LGRLNFSGTREEFFRQETAEVQFYKLRVGNDYFVGGIFLWGFTQDYLEGPSSVAKAKSWGRPLLFTRKIGPP